MRTLCRCVEEKCQLPAVKLVTEHTDSALGTTTTTSAVGVIQSWPKLEEIGRPLASRDRRLVRSQAARKRPTATVKPASCAF